MYGYGRGRSGYGQSLRCSIPNVSQPSGYRYVGGCRCGWGPNAFYEDASGRVVHASELYRWGRQTSPVFSPGDPRAELEVLSEEKKDLEKRIAELEKMIKETQQG